jgi:hypothetical protein
MPDFPWERPQVFAARPDEYRRFDRAQEIVHRIIVISLWQRVNHIYGTV